MILTWYITFRPTGFCVTFENKLLFLLKFLVSLIKHRGHKLIYRLIIVVTRTYRKRADGLTNFCE